MGALFLLLAIKAMRENLRMDLIFDKMEKPLWEAVSDAGQSEAKGEDPRAHGRDWAGLDTGI